MRASKMNTGRTLAYSVMVIALVWLVTIRVPTAIWIGPFSLNAYLTGIVALLAGVLALITLFSLRDLTTYRTNTVRTPPALIVASISALPFLGDSVIILLLDFRIEGFQNALVWAAFSIVIFALPLWLRDFDLTLIRQSFRVVVIVVPVTKIVAFYGGFDFYGEASYALVAMLLLAWAVSHKPSAWFDYVAPWLILFSILLCDVRTVAVVAAALMIFSVQHIPLPKVWKVVAGVIAAGFSSTLVWLFVGDRIVNSGDQGLAELLGQDSILSGIGTTNRAAGWAYLFDNLPEGTNWFGQGAGLSSYLIDELLGIHHPHNEYIRIFFDFGVVGLGLFLLGSLALFVSLIVVHLRNREGITLAAPLMVAAVALTALTDNPIVFAYVMVPVAVVISAALATDMLRHANLSAPTV